MVTISCSGKFHAFALAEQMERKGVLNSFFTTYASGKNTFLKNFVRRKDKEEIPVAKIKTNAVLAFPIKLWQPKVHLWNDYFDQWVAGQLGKNSGRIFIGWSGMSLHSIRKAKSLGMKTILERGSTHIVFQNLILKEEYRNLGKEFSIHPSVISKELKEYEEADYISVPSDFVKKSFLEMGAQEDKILVNPYGASNYFKFDDRNAVEDRKFTIVYLGTVSVRKGLLYFFEALKYVNIPIDRFEVLIIGSIDKEMIPIVEKHQKSNWKLFGHVDHYILKEYLSNCDIGVQPSLEEGLSMVIPQMMACGVPVIITENTGGGNIIVQGKNGFIVPIRDPVAIRRSIEYLYENPSKLSEMKIEAEKAIDSGFKWEDYGERYYKNVIKILNYVDSQPEGGVFI